MSESSSSGSGSGCGCGGVPTREQESRVVRSEQIDRIDQFSGAYRWLSNFPPAPVYLDGVLYESVEYAYQASKTDDPDERETVRRAHSPGVAKRLGRNVTLVRDWNDRRLEVMLGLLRQKFSNEPFKSKLLSTGTALLVEGNNWGDTYWGVCQGKGENWLGRLIMRVRTELREGKRGDE